MASVAIIGAGLAGLVVARELAPAHNVVVFEKSRGVGGRMATRRAGAFEFDHGAQFFTARSAEFRFFLEPLIDAGIVADWPARFVELRRDEVVSDRQWDGGHPHYVGVPAMNAVGKSLADGLDVRLEVAVKSMSREGACWQLFDNDQLLLGEFDWVVVTTPSLQAAELLPSSSIASAAAEVQMHACYALLLGFEKPLDLSWQAALVKDADISWISVNSSKQGRPEPTSIVVHSTNAWANAHVNDELAAVRQHLAGEFLEITHIDPANAHFVDLQRWRYANVDRQDGDLYALDGERQLAACGDWFVRGRVEGAFTSAHALARRMRAEAAVNRD